jgi:hypothetical protein
MASRSPASSITTTPSGNDRQSDIGKLDKAGDEANAEGWTVVSMKGRSGDKFPSSQ